MTICTQDRICLFGDVVDDNMRLSDAGQIVRAVWEQMPERYCGVDLDAFVIMPNHIHGIVVLNVGAGPRACPDCGQPQGVAPTTPMSLPQVVHRFKSLITARYRRAVVERGWPAFRGRVWQRNYYEHIIRNEEELRKLRKYISDNPLAWAVDRENPDAMWAKARPCPPVDDIERIFGGVRP